VAHKKGQGSTRNGRDSPGQHRGIKIYAGETVKAEYSRAPMRHSNPSGAKRRAG